MVDRYTRAVLTVIAACLVWQCVMGLGHRVEARQGGESPRASFPSAQRVVIVGWGEMDSHGQVTVRTRRTRDGVVSDPQLPYSSASPLPVGVAQNPLSVVVTAPVAVTSNPSRPLPVAINGVKDASGVWDPIRAKVEPEGTRKGPGGQ